MSRVLALYMHLSRPSFNVIVTPLSFPSQKNVAVCILLLASMLNEKDRPSAEARMRQERVLFSLVHGPFCYAAAKMPRRY